MCVLVYLYMLVYMCVSTCIYVCCVSVSVVMCVCIFVCISVSMCVCVCTSLCISRCLTGVYMSVSWAYVLVVYISTAFVCVFCVVCLLCLCVLGVCMLSLCVCVCVYVGQICSRSPFIPGSGSAGAVLESQGRAVTPEEEIWANIWPVPTAPTPMGGGHPCPFLLFQDPCSLRPGLKQLQCHAKLSDPVA